MAKAKTQYAWKEGTRFPVPAAVAGRELDRLRRANGDHLTADAVVEAARPEASPLHPAFEWDDGVAAEAYRREQARCLVRSVRVITEPAGPPKIAYVRVDVPAVGSAYVTTARATSDEDLRRQMLADAVTLLRGCQRRFRELDELARLFAVMDEELGRIEGDIGGAEAPAA